MKHVLIQERKSLFLFLRYLLLLFVMPTELIAQSITISGTVTDSNKEAVIGANVLLKGTSTGTITDVEGKYQLTVPENGTLVFSSVGYTSQEIAVNKRRIINVTLSDDIMLTVSYTHLRGQSSEMPDGGARKVTRRGRPSCPFRDCFYSNDDVVQENIWKSSKLLQKAEKERKSDL